MILVFDDDFVGPEYLRYIREMSENRHIRIRPEYLPCIRKLLAFIEEESSRHPQDYRKMQKLYLQELLILISRYRQDQAKEPPQYPEIYRIIMEVAKYIADNISQELNLDVLSKKYAISSGYLSKLFKKVTGIGLNDYIMLTRITAAQKLLSKNDCRVTDVAMACGFNDSAYFSKSFKEITGVTPKKYQMQCMRNGKEQQS